MRKWVLFVLVVTIVVIVIAAATGTLSQYVAAWKAWLGGTATSGVAIGGWTVLLWGRLGKIMEFLAGLVVVFDFVDIDKLRASGRRARERYEHGLIRLKATRAARQSDLLVRRLRRTVLKGPAAEIPPGMRAASPDHIEEQSETAAMRVGMALLPVLLPSFVVLGIISCLAEVRVRLPGGDRLAGYAFVAFVVCFCVIAVVRRSRTQGSHGDPVAGRRDCRRSIPSACRATR